MNKRPVILVSPEVDHEGREFGDFSISLSRSYLDAVLAVGALPLTLPTTTSREAITACVNQCDGVMLTGGDDVEPRLYAQNLPRRICRTLQVTPDGGERDFREILLIDEVFRQRKPLLAICRGHQLLNVALGGTLIADIRAQKPGARDHRHMARRSEVVHDVQLTSGSTLAKITGRQILGVNSTHHQAVGRVAPPLRVSALSSDGIIEGLELKPEGRAWLPFLVSVQFHPERLVDRHPEHRAIFVTFARTCSLRRRKDL